MSFFFWKLFKFKFLNSGLFLVAVLLSFVLLFECMLMLIGSFLQQKYVASPLKLVGPVLVML